MKNDTMIFPIFASFIAMKNTTKAILFVLTALLLFVSILQKEFNLFSFRALKGVVEEQPKPVLTFANCQGGSYQTQTEQYLKQHFGCREPLIRLYNQYLWDFYGKTPVSEGQIVFGKHGWIYEPWVVNDYYQVHFRTHAYSVEEMTQKLEKEAKRVYQLQHILEPYGTHLFVCMPPSKDRIYPEYLPEEHDMRFENEEKMSARFFYEEEYPKLGVNFLDLEQDFLLMKDTANFMLFPQTGTHWSRYSALFAADTLIRYMEHLGDMNIQNLVIGPRVLKDAEEPDIDLESLLNLIRPLPRPKYYYATATADHDSTAVKPKMITVGDSFWWNVIQQMPTEIFSAAPYWYYNSTIYFDDKHHSVKEVDFVDEILSADFINLCYSSTQLYRMNNDFTKMALIALCYDPEEVEAVYAAIDQAIYANTSWLERLKNKADTQGRTLDDVIQDERKWLIDNYPEKYFTALNDSIPTKRSQRAEAYLAFDSLTFIEQEVEKVILEFKGNPQMMASIQEKADQKNKTLEQALYDDAVWVVNYKIEHGKLTLPKTRTRVKTKTENHGIQ